MNVQFCPFCKEDNLLCRYSCESCGHSFDIGGIYEPEIKKIKKAGENEKKADPEYVIRKEANAYKYLEDYIKDETFYRERIEALPVPPGPDTVVGYIVRLLKNIKTAWDEGLEDVLMANAIGKDAKKRVKEIIKNMDAGG